MQAGIQGIQDMTFTVADLDQATEFFVSFFGAEAIADGGPVADRRGSTMRDVANADVRSELHRSRLLRTPFLNLKLLEASYPGQRDLWPMMLDVGGWHLAGYVDDMDEAMAFAEAADIYVLGPGKKPTTNGPEVGEGSFACHAMTAFGFHFELLSYPNGRAYMADFDTRLWNPTTPDRGATLRSAAGGIPGFRGFEHLAVAVADIAETTAFLEDVIGCETFYEMGPISDPYGSGFGAYANVDARVSAAKVRLFRCGYLNFEIIEPTFPGQNRNWPGLLDVGGWQLTFAVEDLDEAMAYMRSKGIRLLGGRREDDWTGMVGKQARASFLTSFGLYFDLVEGAPVQTDSGLAGWHPAFPER